MVAITVILAAVIGAFVLEIGDQQETAPNTSFESGERVVFTNNQYGHKANVTKVRVAHAGGSVIDVTQADIVVNGNSSTWGPADPDNMNNPSGWITAIPQPNVKEALGSNEEVVFKSGREWHVIGYEMWDDELVTADSSYRFSHRTDSNGCLVSDNIEIDWSNGPTVEGPALMQGDNFNVIWTAESGGKTQTLFKYQVQQDSPSVCS
jgi:hypothetical protein